MTIKEELAQIFKYHLGDNSTIRAMLYEMDKAGRMDQKATIEIVQVVVARLEKLENEVMLDLKDKIESLNDSLQDESK